MAGSRAQQSSLLWTLATEALIPPCSVAVGSVSGAEGAPRGAGERGLGPRDLGPWSFPRERVGAPGSRSDPLGLPSPVPCPALWPGGPVTLNDDLPPACEL